MIFYEVYHLNFFLYFFENFFSIKFNFFWEYNTNLNNTIQKKRIIIFYDNVYIYQLLYIFLIFLSYKIKILLHKVWFSIINQINTCEKWVLYPDNFLKADIFFSLKIRINLFCAHNIIHLWNLLWMYSATKKDWLKIWIVYFLYNTKSYKK